MEKNKRYPFIDGIRGIAVLSMVIYHFFWDMNFLTDFNVFSLSKIITSFWQQSISLLFFLISGFCFYLSKKPLKNGIVVFISGALVTLATILIMPDSAIYFGVLSFLGSAMLILLPIRTQLNRIPSIIGISVSLILFLFFHGINYRTALFGIIEMPDSLYKNMATAFLGFPPDSFSSGDYYSFFPWIFVFLIGFFLCSAVKKYGEPKFLFIKIPAFEWIGRHALIIYLAHQPILYGLTLLIRMIYKW